MAFSHFSTLFILGTDDSGTGIGAALLQAVDSCKHRLLAFTSGVLTGAGSCYLVADLEALANVWSLRHFRELIYGYQVVVHTDHQAVAGSFKGNELTGRVARWLEILENYQPSTKYVSGN